MAPDGGDGLETAVGRNVNEALVSLVREGVVKPGTFWRESFADAGPYGRVDVYVQFESISRAGIEGEFEIAMEHAPAMPFTHTSLDPLSFALLGTTGILCLHSMKDALSRFAFDGLEFPHRRRDRLFSGYLHIDSSGVDWDRAGDHRLPVRMADPGRPLVPLGYVVLAVSSSPREA